MQSSASRFGFPDCSGAPPSPGEVHASGSGSGSSFGTGHDGSTSRNRFLASLPLGERQWLVARSERLAVRARTPLYEIGGALKYCYFPENGIVSLVNRLADGFESASGMVGFEGFVGLAALTARGNAAVNAYVAQLPLVALRIPVTALRAAMLRNSQVLDRVLSFDQALMVQIFRTATCNQHHTLQQRLARWLLMIRDRINADELPVTQDFLSAMLGTRRASLTLAAQAIRDTGAIDYRRGHILVSDRSCLEHISCECYGAVREQYQYLLGWPGT
jgi:CRP-like cAMP-binding protein